MSVQGAQGFVDDPRNDALLVYVNGNLLPKAEAKVSVFDSGFVLGDGVWDAFRLVDATLVFMAEHLERLFEGARSIDLDIGLTEKELADALYRTVDANGMRDGAHLRLMVTRGVKKTPNQDGLIHDQGTPQEVLLRPRERRTREFLEGHGLFRLPEADR